MKQNIREQLDRELKMAEEMLGAINTITLYKDKYEELCELLGQSELHIYKGIRVSVTDELSTDPPADSGSK